MNQFVKDESKEPKVIEMDPVVKDAIELILSSKNSTRRQRAMSNIREDKEIYEALTSGLKNKQVFDQIKDTTMMQVVRIVSEDAYSLPDGVPTSTKEVSEDILAMVNTIKKKYQVEGKLKERMRDVIEHACFMEGTSFIKISPESMKDYRAGVQIDKLKFTRVDSAKMFYDPNCISDISDGEWDADMETYGFYKAQEIARDLYKFTEPIATGTPLNAMEPQEGTGDSEKLPTEGDITFFTLRHKTKFIEVVFAGGNAQLIKKTEGIENYRCKDQYGHPDTPIVQFEATALKDGIHASSYIGVAKDITRHQTSQWNTMLPHLSRINSPILVALGAVTPQEFSDQVADANEAQEQGIPGVVSLSDPQARVDTLYPQDISAAFERIMTMFDNALAKRLGLVLSVQEKQVTGSPITATQTIEQAKVHAKAIANLNKLNIKFFTRISELVVSYGHILLKGSKETFNVMWQDDAITLTGTQLVDITKNWRGEWSIDTSVEIKLTKNEKVSLLTEFIKDLTGYTQLTIMTEAEVKLLKDAVWAKILMLQFDEYFQAKEVDEFFKAIAAKNQQQQALDLQQQEAGSGEQVTNDGGEGIPETQRQAARLGGAAIAQSGTAGI